MNHHFCFLRMTEDFANNTLPMNTIYKIQLFQTQFAATQSELSAIGPPIHRTASDVSAVHNGKRANESRVLVPNVHSADGPAILVDGAGLRQITVRPDGRCVAFYFLLHMRLNPAHTYILIYIYFHMYVEKQIQSQTRIARQCGNRPSVFAGRPSNQPAGCACSEIFKWHGC